MPKSKKSTKPVPPTRDKLLAMSLAELRDILHDDAKYPQLTMHEHQRVRLERLQGMLRKVATKMQ